MIANIRKKMKAFKRVQTIVAFAAMWTAIAVSNNYEATGNEIFASIVLALLAGMVIIGVLIDKTKEEAE